MGYFRVIMNLAPTLDLPLSAMSPQVKDFLLAVTNRLNCTPKEAIVATLSMTANNGFAPPTPPRKPVLPAAQSQPEGLAA